MGLSIFVLGIVLGAFVLPGVLTDPQTAFETGKDVASSVSQIMEMIKEHV